MDSLQLYILSCITNAHTHAHTHAGSVCGDLMPVRGNRDTSIVDPETKKMVDDSTILLIFMGSATTLVAFSYICMFKAMFTEARIRVQSRKF